MFLLLIYICLFTEILYVNYKHTHIHQQLRQVTNIKTESIERKKETSEKESKQITQDRSQ